MAIITCWALKGGSGTTVVAAGIALSEPGAVLIDLDGELPAALGIVEPAGQGITEWLTSDAPPSAIDDLAIAGPSNAAGGTLSGRTWLFFGPTPASGTASDADLVFTGGYSLYEAKRSLHRAVHPFPSSVDVAHFAAARTPGQEPADQAALPRPRFGFYGVIDERMDLELVAALADARDQAAAAAWQHHTQPPQRASAAADASAAAAGRVARRIDPHRAAQRARGDPRG